MMRTILFTTILASGLLGVSEAAAGDSTCYPLTQVSSVPLGGAWNIAAESSHVYVGQPDGVKVFDVSSPDAPQLVNTLDLDGDMLVHVHDSILYCSNRFGNSHSGQGVRVFDVSDPGNPMFLVEMEPGQNGQSVDIEFANDLVYMLSGGNLYIYDMSNPAIPELIGSAENLEGAMRMEVEGSRVYAGWSSGLTILDATDPETPVVLNTLPYSLTGGITSMQVRDGIVYVCRQGDGFRTIDVTDAQNPVVLDPQFWFAGPQINANIELDGDVAFISQSVVRSDGSEYDEYFGVVDISDPSNLVRINHVVTDSRLRRGTIALQSGFAYLAGQELMVHDISNLCACPADFTGDGVLDFFDVSMFLSAYNDADPIADFNADGMYDFFDVSAFISAYQAGCP